MDAALDGLALPLLAVMAAGGSANDGCNCVASTSAFPEISVEDAGVGRKVRRDMAAEYRDGQKREAGLK